MYRRRIYAPQPLASGSYHVWVQAIWYPPYVVLYRPNVPFLKNNLGVEEIKDPDDITDNIPQSETNEERATRRAKKAIRDYAVCNEFDMFVTFTFKADRDDIPKCISRMHHWIKNQNKRTGSFGYLIVMEFHSDGKSVHFHALLKGYKGKVTPAINPKTGKHVIQNGRQCYSLPGYTAGFTTMTYVDTDPLSRLKTAAYLGKYITKDMPVFANKNRYWASKGLAKPIREDNPARWYLDLELAPDDIYEGDYGIFEVYQGLTYDMVKHYKSPIREEQERE